MSSGANMSDRDLAVDLGSEQGGCGADVTDRDGRDDRRPVDSRRGPNVAVDDLPVDGRTKENGCGSYVVELDDRGQAWGEQLGEWSQQLELNRTIDSRPKERGSRANVREFYGAIDRDREHHRHRADVVKEDGEVENRRREDLRCRSNVVEGDRRFPENEAVEDCGGSNVGKLDLAVDGRAVCDRGWSDVVEGNRTVDRDREHLARRSDVLERDCEIGNDGSVDDNRRTYVTIDNLAVNLRGVEKGSGTKMWKLNRRKKRRREDDRRRTNVPITDLADHLRRIGDARRANVVESDRDQEGWGEDLGSRADMSPDDLPIDRGSEQDRDRPDVVRSYGAGDLDRGIDDGDGADVVDGD